MFCFIFSGCTVLDNKKLQVEGDSLTELYWKNLDLALDVNISLLLISTFDFEANNSQSHYLKLLHKVYYSMFGSKLQGRQALGYKNEKI